MIKFIKNFRKDEDGAVTVDWVVLTAAVVGLGIAAVTTVSNGIDSAASTLTNDLDSSMTSAAAVN
ncbi:MAG: pilus assembly protein [Thalassovita sp.]|nr:pilus assembly protein [Thalassovita sp.]